MNEISVNSNIVQIQIKLQIQNEHNFITAIETRVCCGLKYLQMREKVYVLSFSCRFQQQQTRGKVLIFLSFFAVSNNTIILSFECFTYYFLLQVSTTLIFTGFNLTNFSFFQVSTTLSVITDLIPFSTIIVLNCLIYNAVKFYLIFNPLNFFLEITLIDNIIICSMHFFSFFMSSIVVDKRN